MESSIFNKFWIPGFAAVMAFYDPISFRPLKETKMNLLFLNKWIILVSLAALTGGCNTERNTSQGKSESLGRNAPLVRDKGSIFVPEDSPLRKSLQVAAVEEQWVERPVVVPGEVEADPAKMIKVVSPVSGRIVKLNKKLGDMVKKEEALFTLDSTDLAQSFSEAAKSQEALNLAKRNLDRQKELNAAGISARKELDLAETEFNQAAGEAERTKARLALLGCSLSQGNNRLYTLCSPINGRVIELTGTQGAFWNDTNAPIMTIANLSSVWVAASVQEKEIGSVFQGQTATISFNAYEGESFEGKVRYLGEIFDPDTHTVKVRIALDNSSGRFRPGMFGSVTFRYPAKKTILVPAKALVQRGFNTVVFVETSPWRFESRICKTGLQLDDQVEITTGLKAGERIVVKEGVILND
ncbi:MAG: efflux RND transporter periplasmic adaptor subunit [Deltaproteobacteria bacterium]|nr:efflux RND transporter periplasmic adaptor subunit [Deltaproteobacteria bacterium]